MMHNYANATLTFMIYTKLFFFNSLQQVLATLWKSKEKQSINSASKAWSLNSTSFFVACRSLKFIPLSSVSDKPGIISRNWHLYWFLKMRYREMQICSKESRCSLSFEIKHNSRWNIKSVLAVLTPCNIVITGSHH